MAAPAVVPHAAPHLIAAAPEIGLLLAALVYALREPLIHQLFHLLGDHVPTFFHIIFKRYREQEE